MYSTRICLSLLFSGIALLVAGQAVPFNRFYQENDFDTHLLGRVTYDQFYQQPYAEWFIPEYESYEPEAKVIEALKSQEIDSITIFLGTWCGDSKREVPRFFKVLQATGFPLSKVGIVCLQNGFYNYKRSPSGEETGFNIHRVPHFLVWDHQGREKGRISEWPKVSLEADLLSIASGVPYVPHYPVVFGLDSLIRQRGVAWVQAHQDSLGLIFQGKTENVFELNTYGYKLMTSWQMGEALVVYELNQLLYPDELRVYISLAFLSEKLLRQGEALSYYQKALTLAPESEGIKRAIKRIQTQIEG